MFKNLNFKFNLNVRTKTENVLNRKRLRKKCIIKKKITKSNQVLINDNEEKSESILGKLAKYLIT